MKTDIKIMKEKNNISDEEIFSRMNFDKLLEMRNKQVAARSRKIRIGAGILLLILISFVASFLLIINDKNDVKPIAKEIKPERKASIQKEAEVIVEKSVPETIINKEPNSKVKTEAKTPKKSGNTIDYREAMPKQGYDQLFKFFEKNIQYPSTAKANKIEGTVMVEFYINVDGKPEEIVIVKSISHELNEEAIRLITIMPAWNPATYDGNKISTKIVLPLTFKLEK